MNLHLSIGPLVSLSAGILILVMPKLLNYIVAIYLIIIGLVGLFGTGALHLWLIDTAAPSRFHNKPGTRRRTIAARQCRYLKPKERPMLGLIVLIVLIVLLLGAIPRWPHSRSWGYGPSSGLGIVLIIVIVLLLMGRI